MTRRRERQNPFDPTKADHITAALFDYMVAHGGGPVDKSTLAAEVAKAVTPNQGYRWKRKQTDPELTGDAYFRKTVSGQRGYAANRIYIHICGQNLIENNQQITLDPTAHATWTNYRAGQS